MATIMTNITTNMAPITGLKVKTTAIEVIMPLPPLKPKNTGNTWPSITQTAATYEEISPSEKR